MKGERPHEEGVQPGDEIIAVRVQPGASGVNQLALNWVDVALALEEENRELRRLMTALLMAIAHNRELRDMARGLLDERAE